MRRGCRGDSWLVGAASLILAACGAAAPEHPVRDVVPSPPPRPRAELVRDARAWPRAFAPFVSRGHGDGGYTIDIRVSPAALSSFRDLVLGGSVPAGTSVVAFHSGVSARAAASTYAMRKGPDGGWDFLIADSDDRVVARGALPLCARCHAEAPADSLFVRAAE